MVHAGCVFLPAFNRLGHKCQDLLSPCDRMQVCTDNRSVYTLVRKSFWLKESDPMSTPTEKLYRRLRGGWDPQRCFRQDSEPNTLPRLSPVMQPTNHHHHLQHIWGSPSLDRFLRNWQYLFNHRESIGGRSNSTIEVVLVDGAIQP